MARQRPFRRQSQTASTERWIAAITLLLVLLISEQQRQVSAFSSSHFPVRYAKPKTFTTNTRMLATHTEHAETPEGAHDASEEEEEFFVHGIVPKTRTLPRSMEFYAQYVINRMVANRRKRLRKRRGKRGLRFWKKKVEPLPEEEEHLGWIGGMKVLNEQRRNLVKLAGYTAPIVVPSFSFLLLGALLTSVIPQFYSECITCVATNEASRNKVVRAMAGLAITSTLGALFTGLRGSLFWIAGSRANYNIRVKLHRGLLLQEAAFFDSNEVGYLLSRLNNDVNKIGMVISFHVNVVLRQFAQFVFGSIYLVKISPRLSLWAFGGILLVAFVSAVYGKFNREIAQKLQDTFADATAVAETSFSMSETIRAFDGVADESSRYEDAQNHALELEEVQAWGYGTHKFISDTLQSALQVALLFACWTVGRAGGLSTAKLTTFMFYTNFVLESSNEVGDQWAKIQGAVGASTSVFDLIRRIPSVRDPTPDATQLHRPAALHPQPVISMQNMTITYSAMDVPALDGVDLNIFAGDRVAVVGRSGSGKSTMLRTILRFYDPSSGSCNLNGQSLMDMTRKEISSKVAVVQQEPQLFPMSLMENVLYGVEKDDTDQETGEPRYSQKYRDAATKCLLMAGLPIQENNDLNLELDTRVGEGGRALSGGQRQRVAIARALIRSPEVLLLDEPTAALDSESEKKVVEALRTAMQHSKSMVMVTHRLGVVRSLGVNRVIVLEKGEIAEQGHPEDLLQKPNGLYASLAREQGILSHASDHEQHHSISLNR